MVAPVNAAGIVEQDVEDLEIDLLLDGVFRRFGHDFRGHRRDGLRTRLHRLMAQRRLPTVSALQDSVMHDAEAADALLRTLGAQPVALFDQPGHFRALRETLVPWLRSCPAPRIWIAECVCAEQAATLAILLAEERLADRTRIFATAANESLLREASSGAFAFDRLAEYADNYRKSGGRAELTDYIGEHEGRAVFGNALLANVTWAQYSLATDASFNEFQLILCRGVMSDYGMPLRHRVLRLFDQSMPLFGILSIGRAGDLETVPLAARYRSIAQRQGLYRRIA